MKGTVLAVGAVLRGAMLRRTLWVAVLLLVGCRAKEFVEVARPDGGTLRVTKARQATFRKMAAGLRRYFLVRDGAHFAAIRLLDTFTRDVPGGVDEGVTYDCVYLEDGGAPLRQGHTERGEVFERRTTTETRGVFSTAGEHVNLRCGPFRVGWSSGNWLYPRGQWSGSDLAAHARDKGVEIAETSARTLDEIDVLSPDIDWLLPW